MKVAGETGRETLASLTALRESMKDAFLLDWPEESLRPALSQEGQLPQGILSELDRLLSSGQSDGNGGWNIQEADSYTDEEVAEARYLLREYVRRINK